MNRAAIRANQRKLIILAVVVLLAFFPQIGSVFG